jgi:hypothetical protein
MRRRSRRQVGQAAGDLAAAAAHGDDGPALEFALGV